MAAELITSTENRKRNILSEMYHINKYNLATGKLKKKYVKKPKLTVLEKIQRDFKELN